LRGRMDPRVKPAGDPIDWERTLDLDRMRHG
jgi:hypothetical protein